MKGLIDETINNIIAEEKHELYEMARVGFTDDGFEVYVNTDDGGNIPHFHYRKGKYPNFTFHTCIRLDDAKYFHHSGKEDVLNSNQRKSLMSFLNSPNKSSAFENNWYRLLADWNANNSDIQVDEKQSMPNYLNLK